MIKILVKPAKRTYSTYTTPYVNRREHVHRALIAFSTPDKKCEEPPRVEKRGVLTKMKRFKIF